MEIILHSHANIRYSDMNFSHETETRAYNSFQDSSESFINVLSEAYCDLILPIVRSGLKSRFTSEHIVNNDLILRRVPNFEKQIQKYGSLDARNPMEIIKNGTTVDILENQILKAAIQFLINYNPANSQKLGFLLQKF